MPVPDEVLADPNRYFTEFLPSKIEKRDDLAQRIGSIEAVVQMTLDGEGGGAWHFVVKDGTVKVETGKHDAASFGVVMSVETWRAIQKRELEPQAAFFGGKVKLEGDLAKAMQLMPLFR